VEGEGEERWDRRGNFSRFLRRSGLDSGKSSPKRHSPQKATAAAARTAVSKWDWGFIVE
jgi:hypothetical protein